MSSRIARGVLLILTAATLQSCQQTAANPVEFALGWRDYSIDPTLTYQRFDFERIINTPQQGMDCAFIAMFDRHDERIWQPFYTSISPEEYVSFSAWAPKARIWEIRGRSGSVPTLYCRKNSSHLDELQKLKRYQLVELRGTVRSVYEGRPWIEIFYVMPVSRTPVYSDDSVRQLYAGIKGAEKSPNTAVKNLTLSLSGKLFTPGRAAAHHMLGGLYAKRAESDPASWQLAVEHYEEALDIDENNQGLAMALDNAKAKVEEHQRDLAARAEAGLPPPTPSPEPTPEVTPDVTPEPMPTPEPEPEPTPTEEPAPMDPQ